MIIYTNFVPTGFDSITLWPFILMRPQRKSDAGLLGHEMVHYREQAWITPIWWLRYALSKKFRVAAEVRAYQTQVDCGSFTVINAAVWLLKYDSSLSLENAVAMFHEPKAQ